MKDHASLGCLGQLNLKEDRTEMEKLDILQITSNTIRQNVNFIPRHSSFPESVTRLQPPPYFQRARNEEQRQCKLGKLPFFFPLLPLVNLLPITIFVLSVIVSTEEQSSVAMIQPSPKRLQTLPEIWHYYLRSFFLTIFMQVFTQVPSS